MEKIEREDIQIIARHSNWSEKSIDKILKKNIYNDKESWNKFLRLFFISLGVGFTTAGIIFFFAYNWADLHKFIKNWINRRLNHHFDLGNTILKNKFRYKKHITYRHINISRCFICCFWSNLSNRGKCL